MSEEITPVDLLNSALENLDTFAKQHMPDMEIAEFQTTLLGRAMNDIGNAITLLLEE